MPSESAPSIPKGVEEVDPVFRFQLRQTPIRYDTYEAVESSPEYQTLVSGFIKKGEEFTDKVIAAVESGKIKKPADSNTPYPPEVLALRDEFLVFAKEAMKANDELPYDGVCPGVGGLRIRGLEGSLMASIRIAMEDKIRPYVVGGPNYNPVLAAYWDVITMRSDGTGGSVARNGLLAETSCDREKRLQFKAVGIGALITSLAIDQLGLGKGYKITPEQIDTKIEEFKDTISEVLKQAAEDNLKVDAVWGVIKQGIKREVDILVRYRWIKVEDAPKLLTQASVLFERLK